MTAPYVARAYHDHAHATPVAEVVLDYEGRFLRRKMLATTNGRQVLVDLAQTTSLEQGGVLITETGDEIAVKAAAEPLLEVRGPDLHRLAWHIGNRHTPCQIEAARLVIQANHVMQDMLTRLGAQLTEVSEPFTPERGAYGHGRTHSHDHGHSAHTHAADDAASHAP